MADVSEEDSIFNLSDDDVDDDEGCDGIYRELNLPWDYSECERMRYVSPVPWETDTSIYDGAYISSSGDEGEEGAQYYAGAEYAEGEYEEYYKEDEEYTEDKVKSPMAKGLESKDPKSKAAHDARTPFTKMQEKDLPSKLFVLNQAYERAQWRVIELQEIHHNVKKELAKAEEEEKSLWKKLDEKREKFDLEAETLGISRKLWNKYEAFCESMEPEFGSASGWSITCDEKHQGSYVGVGSFLFFFVGYEVFFCLSDQVSVLNIMRAILPSQPPKFSWYSIY